MRVESLRSEKNINAERHPESLCVMCRETVRFAKQCFQSSTNLVPADSTHRQKHQQRQHPDTHPDTLAGKLLTNEIKFLNWLVMSCRNGNIQPDLFGHITIKNRNANTLLANPFTTSNLFGGGRILNFLQCLNIILLLLLPLALQRTVGFGLSKNVLPFFPVCHQLSPSSHSQHLKISFYFLFPSFSGPSPYSHPFQFLSEDLFGHPILLHSL